MQKLIRLLVIYTAVATTIILINTYFAVRSITEQDKSVRANFDSLKQELAKIIAYQQSEKAIVQKLDSLESKISDNEIKQVLGTNNQTSDSSKITSGFVTINDKKWQNVDVYESNSYSSKTIAKIEFGKAYRYIKKEGSWYQIVLLKPEIQGWVPGRFLEEMEANGLKR